MCWSRTCRVSVWEVLILTPALLVWDAHAQTGRAAQIAPISTDRPSESAGPGVVPSGLLQVEMGYRFSREEDPQGQRIGTQQVPDLLLRFGVLDKLEVRLTMSDWSFQDTASGDTTGFNDLSLGAKWAFAQGRGLRPATSLLADVSLPVGADAFTNDAIAPKILLLFTSTLSDRVSLTYNAGASIAGDTGDNGAKRKIVDLPYTAMLAGPLTGRWSWFGEVFGAFACNKARVPKKSDFETRFGVK